MRRRAAVFATALVTLANVSPLGPAAAGEDNTPPTTMIQSPLPRPFALQIGATFTLSSNELGAMFSCRLDTAVFGACGTLARYSGLGPGTHTFRARATDAAGNVDATPAVFSWTVPHDDRELGHGAGWRELTGARFWRGTALRTTQRDAVLLRRDVRARRLALVATTCATCGSVDVFHGDRRIERVSLLSRLTTDRVLLQLANYDTLSPAGDIRIVVTSRDAPVTIDGLAIAR